MAFDAHLNFAYSLVATAPSPATSGTSLVVTASQGALFPTAPFNATVWPAGSQPTTTNAEIVRVTAISTDTFTITRAQESTTARTIVVGDQIAATITKKTLTDIEAGVNGLNSATTVVNVSAATAPSTGQSLIATSSTTATWQTAAGGGAPQFSIRPGYDESYWDADSTSGTYVHSHNSKGYHHGATPSSTIYGKLGWLNNGNLAAGAMKNMTGYVLGSIESQGGTAYGTYYLKFFSEGASSSFNGVTVNHIGLKLDLNGSFTETDSSTVGNGTSGTTTTISGSNMNAHDQLITFKQPTVAAGDVTFYLNGASKNVHSSNQPTFAANSQFLGFYIIGGGGSLNFNLLFREMGIQGDMY